MSLHEHPAEGTTTLPDGRDVTVRVEVPDDDYVAEAELRTVALSVSAGDELLAVLNTVLTPEHEQEAGELVREALAGLASGELEPTAGGLEALADTIPSVRDRS